MNPIRKTLSLGLFAVLILSGRPLAAPDGIDPAQGSHVSVTSAMLSLSGTSTMHPYTVSTKALKVISSSASTADAQGLLQPGALQGFELQIPVNTFTSDKDGLTKQMFKATKADKHPLITFRFNSYTVEPAAGGTTVKPTGALTVAGVERPIDMVLEVKEQKDIIAVGSITGGEVRGTVLSPKQRSASYIGKLGFDRQVNPNLRVRLTGSMYKTNNSASNTLYGGDRAGSRYYYVVENTAATESAQFTSGAINPGFRNKVTAFQVNPFVKFGGLELFGVIERAQGRASAEAANREIRQYALDTIYRVGPSDELFVAARYNKFEGELAGIAGDVGANRWQLGAGMFLTPMLMAKIEYVKQEFTGYPVNHVRHGGKFNGLMFEGVVGF